MAAEVWRTAARRRSNASRVLGGWPLFSLELWLLGVASAAVLTVYLLTSSHSPQMDFQVYRTGSQHLLGNDLYSSRIALLGQHLFFTYPPFAAALFWPFSLLPPLAAQRVWDVVNLLALTGLIAVSIAAARSRTLIRSDWRTALILVGTVGLLLEPVVSSLSLGQVNILLVLMIATDLTTGVRWRGRSLPRGVLVGLASAVKLTPLLFIPYLLLTGQWRAARNATITFLGVTAALFAASPGASWAYFTKYAYEIKRVTDPVNLGNQSLYAALLRLHLHLPGALDELIMALTCCAGIAVSVVAYRRSSTMVAMLVCAATTLLVSPVSWGHHYVWIVPLLVWLAIGADRPAKAAWWVAVAVIVFVAFPLVPPGSSGPWSQIRGDCYVIPTLAFIGLVGTMLWFRARRGSPSLAGAMNTGAPGSGTSDRRDGSDLDRGYDRCLSSVGS